MDVFDRPLFLRYFPVQGTPCLVAKANLHSCDPKRRPEQVYGTLDLHQIERNRVPLLTKQQRNIKTKFNKFPYFSVILLSLWGSMLPAGLSF